MRKGNKQNSGLNEQWASHVRRFLKKLTAHKRRLSGQKEIRTQLNES